MIRGWLHRLGLHKWRKVMVRVPISPAGVDVRGHWRACELCGKLQKDTGWGGTEWSTQRETPAVEEL